MKSPLPVLAVLAAICTHAFAAEPQRPPTHANVAYGAHERQVLDFWQAASNQPTPLVFHIHGGGWVAGDKRPVANLEDYLAAGISVVSINYRYSTQAQIAGVKPPVAWPLSDAARALQFVRSQAVRWNLDKARIGASGTSAGACSSLWLAFHKDLAEPKSADPVARESTRLWCAAVIGAQTSLDPQQLKEWTPNSRYGGHAFGFMPDPKDNATRDTQGTAHTAENHGERRSHDAKKGRIGWTIHSGDFRVIHVEEAHVRRDISHRAVVGRHLFIDSPRPRFRTAG